MQIVLISDRGSRIEQRQKHALFGTLPSFGLCFPDWIILEMHITGSLQKKILNHLGLTRVDS